ncbi:MAG: hypothetical protein Q8N51_12795 [Gammaproteobacteria bacterium]|nr:hypothetical protein [Gammaproteobacteria bacterium]
MLGLAGAMEVSTEPVAIVVQFPDMKQISLAPEDVMIYSEDIPRVETVTGAQTVYAQRTMAEMVAANIPEPPPESQPTLPNESRKKKRLDHTPPFHGTVTGDIDIIESGPTERIIVVSNIKGDGIMQVLVKGGTAKSATGLAAKPVLNTPRIVVRNTKSATNVTLEKAAVAGAVPQLEAAQQASLESHFQGALPANIKVLADPIVVK